MLPYSFRDMVNNVQPFMFITTDTNKNYKHKYTQESRPSQLQMHLVLKKYVVKTVQIIISSACDAVCD